MANAGSAKRAARAAAMVSVVESMLHEEVRAPAGAGRPRGVGHGADDVVGGPRGGQTGAAGTAAGVAPGEARQGVPRVLSRPWVTAEPIEGAKKNDLCLCVVDAIIEGSPCCSVMAQAACLPTAL